MQTAPSRRTERSRALSVDGRLEQATTRDDEEINSRLRLEAGQVKTAIQEDKPDVVETLRELLESARLSDIRLQ